MGTCFSHKWHKEQIILTMCITRIFLWKVIKNQYFSPSPNPMYDQLGNMGNGNLGHPGRNQDPIAAQVEALVQRLVGDNSRRGHRQIGQKPYFEWINRANPFPKTSKIPDFTLFSGNDRVSVEEHLVRCNCQCREVVDSEFLKSRMFSMSQTDTDFWWYTS